MHRMGMFYITFITIKRVCLSIKQYVSRILNVSSEIALSPEKENSSAERTNTRVCWLVVGMKLLTSL